MAVTTFLTRNLVKATLQKPDKASKRVLCRNAFYFWHSVVTHYHIIPAFNTPWKESFRKHCEKKDKMLVTSIFFFFHNVFYSSQHKFQFLSHYYFVICVFCHLVKSELIKYICECFTSCLLFHHCYQHLWRNKGHWALPFFNPWMCNVVCSLWKTSFWGVELKLWKIIVCGYSISHTKHCDKWIKAHTLLLFPYGQTDSGS